MHNDSNGVIMKESATAGHRLYRETLLVRIVWLSVAVGKC